MFERLGSWTYRFRFLIVLAWIVAGAFFAALAPSISGEGSTDQTSFLPSSAPSVQAKAAIERAFPGSTSSSSATITMDRPGGLTDADRRWRDEFAAWAASDEAPEKLRAAVTETETADSRPELKDLFRGDDGTFELFVVNLDVADAGDEAKAVVEELRDHLRATAPDGLETHVTGAAAISSDYLEAVQVGTDSTTIVTVILVIVILLLIYRAPLAALIPLATIGAAFVVSKGVLGFLAAAGWQVSSTLETFLVVMVFGVGTDYAIFLISRYREEVSHETDWHDAAKVTVKRIGAVITASAGTVIVGMMAMGVGDFKMITSMGPGIAIAVAVTLLAALTLSPALLSIFGHYLFWPQHTREKHEGEPRGFFASLASGVTKRPLAVTIGLTAVLLVPVLYLPQVNSNFDVLADLPKDADSAIGYQQIGDHLGEDKLVQSTALIDLGGDGDILAPAQLARLHALMVELQAAGGMGTTTSLVTPEGDTVVPDGFRPSITLREIADGFADDDASQETGNSSLLDAEVKDGLNQALDYVNGVGVAFPDVAATAELRAARAGLEHAIDIVDRVAKQSVLSTQLRTLSASITSPSASAGGDDSDSTLMGDYLAELEAAYPEVSSLDAHTDAVQAARTLEKDASIAAALDLSDAFARLADHFDGRPDATLSPESLSGTASAKELKKEAEDTFKALPDEFGALAAVFASRPDDIYIPTTLTGDDAEQLQDAIDAFVSTDRTATRVYLTSSNAPYSGDAFDKVKDARVVLEAGAASFGPAASGHIGGPTAQFTDVEDTLAQDFIKVGVITVIGILIVLMLLLRAVVAPLYLVATVLVSYGSTIGVSGFLFQEVLGQQGVSPYLPLIVFVLLVALGSDYNIFLMHRVREEAETRGMRDAVRIASGHTGAVITSAGLILAGTFGSMITAPLTILFQVGAAVAIGVLIDTFLVRSILVPAITALVGDWAWWPSGTAVSGLLGRVPAPVPAGAGAMAVGTVATGSRASRGRLMVGLGLVVLVPVMLAGLLTWSLGGASSNLGSVQAAVVNEDEGGTMTTADGGTEALALGADISTALAAAGTGAGFTWVAADTAQADAGLRDGRYAAVLTIPDDFSRTVAAIRGDPTGTAPRATLRLVTNDSSGYALGTVARQVAGAIESTAARGVTSSYVGDTLLAVTSAHAALALAAGDAGSVADDTSTLADAAAGTEVVAGTLVDGLQEFIDRADETAGGTQQLVAGTRQLADGSAALADGSTELASGARRAAAGADELASGAGQVSSGLAELEAQTTGLPAQTQALADGAAGVATGAAGVAAGASQLADGLATMAGQTTGLGAQGEALDAGAASLESGARDLSDGAGQAAAAASDLADGADQLADGVGGYTDGVAALAASCVALGGTPAICAALDDLAAEGAPLAASADQLASGASQLAGANAQVADGASGVVSGADAVHDGTTQLAAGLPALEAGIADSAAGADELATGAADLADGAAQVAAGTQQLADGMPALAAGIGTLADGAKGLADGMTTYAAGMDRLAGGAGELADGAQLSADGADALADGAAEAADGIGGLTDAMQTAVDAGALVEAQAGVLADDGVTLSDEADALADRLRTSADGTGSYEAETRTRMGDLAADPVGLEATRVNALGGPESGLAPFFMAVAAWVGALAAFLVLPAIWRTDDRRWWRGMLIALGAASAVAVAGSLLMALGMRYLVGIPVADLLQLLAFSVLTALAFTAIVQALVALLGNRGWLLALLFLVVQVAASGVPFTSAAAPGPLAALSPLVPLTYAIDAFRGAIAGGGSSPAVDAVVLGGWLLTSVLVTLAVAAGIGRREPGGEVMTAAG
jgi:RND superfamily putative drug exporter